jgi:general secretion pathway protein J
VKSQAGLTLIELLVALSIFAAIATTGVLALRAGVDARSQLSAADAILSDLQNTKTLLREDLSQVVLRPVRDEFGSVAGPPFLGGAETRRRAPVSGETLLVAFVRAGWTNPDYALPRSSLQYVEYVLRDGALVRRSRPYLDDARGQPRSERVLLSQAETVSLRFFAGESSQGIVWQEGWPMRGEDTSAPKAVELSFATTRIGPLRLLFWIGDIAAPGRGQ